MRKFFVVGLPRSRTYWMSIFLYCTHEAFNYNKNYSKFMESKSFGDSTSCYPWIKDYINGQPVVVIDRNINDCFESSKRLFPHVKIDALEYILSELDSIDNCLRVKYDDINERLEEIWNYCHDTPFNEHRAELMKGQYMENYPLMESVQRELEQLHEANA